MPLSGRSRRLDRKPLDAFQPAPFDGNQRKLRVKADHLAALVSVTQQRRDVVIPHRRVMQIACDVDQPPRRDIAHIVSVQRIGPGLVLNRAARQRALLAAEQQHVNGNRGLFALRHVKPHQIKSSIGQAAPTFSPDGLYFVGPYYDARHAIPDRTPAMDWLP